MEITIQSKIFLLKVMKFAKETNETQKENNDGSHRK